MARTRDIVRRALNRSSTPPPSPKPEGSTARNPAPLSKDAAITQLVQEYIHITAKNSVKRVGAVLATHRRNQFLPQGDVDYLTQIYKSNQNFMTNLERHVEGAALRRAALENCVVRQAFELWTHCKEMNEQIAPVIVNTSAPRHMSPRQRSRSPAPTDYSQIAAPRKSSVSPSRIFHNSVSPRSISITNKSVLSATTLLASQAQLKESQRNALMNTPSPDPSDVHALQNIRDRFVQSFGLMGGQREFHAWVSRQPLDWLRKVRTSTGQSVAALEGSGGVAQSPSDQQEEMEMSF
jgi:hypothetical protein